MAILEVLADGTTTEKSSERINKRILSNRRGSCCGADDSNTNNININFGTNTENAYNNTSTSTAGGRNLEANQVPILENIYTRYVPQRAEILPPPTILAPNNNGNYVVAREYNLPENTNKNNESGAVANETKNSASFQRRGVINNSRPKVVPNVVRKSYQEFP